MEIPSVGYSLGFVEGFLESLIKQGVEGSEGADEALEHFHTVEKFYMEAIRIAAEQKTKLEEIQLNLNGWKKI